MEDLARDCGVLIPVIVPFASSAFGAFVGVFLGAYMSNRPRRVISLSGRIWETEGFNSAFSWSVTKESVPDYFEKVHQAAWIHFTRDKCLSYHEILDWVKKGAPGPNGEKSINLSSRITQRRASRAAQALTGFVFDQGEIQKH